MSPLPQSIAEEYLAPEPVAAPMACPNLAAIAAELTLLDETILQRLG